MKLSLIGRGKEVRPAVSERIGTVLIKEYPEQILERIGAVAIGEKGGKRLYSVMIPALTAQEERDACKIKDEIISSGLVRSVGQGNSIQLVMDIASKMVGAGSAIPYIVAHEIAGCGALSMILDNKDGLEEIMINSPTGRISVYHSVYGLCMTNLKFSSEERFRFMINRLIYKTNKEFGADSPIIDAQAYDGSRVHAQTSPYSESGGVASIRLVKVAAIGLAHLIELGTVTPEELAYIRMAVEGGCSIIFAGAPASGKTTMLRACAKLIPRTERIITIEEELGELSGFGEMLDSVHLRGYGKHGNGSISGQVINALRLRPDQLIIGEIRGAEANEVMFGANIGVQFMTTIHSNSAIDVVTRMKTKPMAVEPALISMLDICVFMKELNGIRKVDEIVEYRWGENMETSDMRAFEATQIFRQGKQAKAAVFSSKALCRFADINVLGKKEAISRMADMAIEIANIHKKGRESEEEYIQRHTGVPE